MTLHLYIIGSVMLLLATAHIAFPRYFNWATELSSVSLINRQMMYVHTFFIALVVFLSGLLCLTSAPAMIETDLGKKVSLGLGLFWLLRLVIQFIGYSSKLWRGKTFETVVHVLFSLLWAYFTAVFMLIAFQ